MKVQYKEGYAVGFKMALGEYYKDALEKETFKVGDIVYDTPVVYYLEWKDALLYINCAIQVTAIDDPLIEYHVLVPNSKRDGITKKETLKSTVAEFLRKLQHGPYSSHDNGVVPHKAAEPVSDEPMKPAKKTSTAKKKPAKTPKAKKVVEAKPDGSAEPGKKSASSKKKKVTKKNEPSQQSLF